MMEQSITKWSHTSPLRLVLIWLAILSLFLGGYRWALQSTQFSLPEDLPLLAVAPGFVRGLGYIGSVYVFLMASMAIGLVQLKTRRGLYGPSLFFAFAVCATLSTVLPGLYWNAMSGRYFILLVLAAIMTGFEFVLRPRTTATVWTMGLVTTALLGFYIHLITLSA